MITLKVRNIFTDVEGELTAKQWGEFERALSFRPQGYQFSQAFNTFIRDKTGKVIRRVWDGWKHQFWKNKTRTYFPTGLMSMAVDYLQKQGVQIRALDFRKKPEYNLHLDLAEFLEDRDYQISTVDEAYTRHRGTIQSATGSGKTAVAARIIHRLGVKPFVFFVTSIDLLTQAKDSFELFLRENGKPIKVGQIGGGVVDIRDVNVCTIQTAVRALGYEWDRKTKFDSDDTDDKTPIEQYRGQIVEMVHEAKGSIFDECQHVRAETCQIVARELKSAYYTFGMSATPYRDEGDDLMIMACFGKKIAQIKASDLIRGGWLVKPSIKIVHIPYETNFRTWQSIYKDAVVENDKYNSIIAAIANKYVQNGRLVLILVQQINHGKDIAARIPGAIFLSGNSPKKKREQGLASMRNKDITCIVSTTIFDEGVDVKALDTVILAGQGKSKTRALQRIGRILRPYTDEKTGCVKMSATAIDFRIHCKYLEEHSVAREDIYLTEPEFQIEHIQLD